MRKNYNEPKFELVRQNESNRVFFTASGPAPTPTPSGSISSMSKVTGSW